MYNNTMSRLRGQGRLVVLLVVAVVAIYVFYNYFGMTAVKGVRLTKDSKVLRYHELAGKVDFRKAGQHLSMEDSKLRGPAHDSGLLVAKQEPAVPDKGRGPEIDDEEPTNGDPREDRLHEHENELEDETEDEEEGEDNSSQMDHPAGKKGRRKFSAFISKTVIEPFQLYTDPNPQYTQFFEKKERLVHLDLKGAPPKLSYLEKLIPLFREMGATGLLIEYEDTFPYRENLVPIAAKNAYTEDDVKKINSLAKQNNLSIIPLVQTFGHMEFVLKGKAYQNLRESEDNPQSIVPMENGSLFLIKAMIQQVFKLHPDATSFHIGCDEVYNLGEGQSKQKIIENHMTKEEVFFTHVRSVGKIVRQLGLQPIMWDDMFRKIPKSVLQKSGVGDLIQPMIWRYERQPQKYFPDDMWSKYGQVFNKVWVASAFKGATGSAQYVTDASFHLENHLNWIEVMMEYGGNPSHHYVNFVGVALTGWQRFDHFATLCELLPAAMPSLAVCLQTLKHGYFDEALHRDVSMKILQCRGLIELRLPQEKSDSTDCSFIGTEFYYKTRALYNIHKNVLGNYALSGRLSGWMSSYNVNHNFSSPGQLQVFVKKAEAVKEKLHDLRGQFQELLSRFFDKFTVEEFLLVQINSHVNKLDKEIKVAKALSKRRVWPRRPLIGLQQDDTSETLILFNSDKSQGAQIEKNIPQNNVQKPAVIPQINDHVLPKGQSAIQEQPVIKPNPQAVVQILPKNVNQNEQQVNQFGQPLGQATQNRDGQFGQPVEQGILRRDSQFEQSRDGFRQPVGQVIPKRGGQFEILNNEFGQEIPKRDGQFALPKQAIPMQGDQIRDFQNKIWQSPGENLPLKKDNSFKQDENNQDNPKHFAIKRDTRFQQLLKPIEKSEDMNRDQETRNFAEVQKILRQASIKQGGLKKREGQ